MKSIGDLSRATAANVCKDGANGHLKSMLESYDGFNASIEKFKNEQTADTMKGL